MKHVAIILTFLLVPFLTSAQVVEIPDEAFKDYLVTIGVDSNQDGEIQLTEAEAITEIEIDDVDITSFVGIKSFTNLTSFIHRESSAETVDLSGMPSLERFEYDGLNDVFAEILLSGCQSLTTVLFEQGATDYYELEVIDLADCIALVDLLLPSFEVIVYDLILRNCTSLERLNADHVTILETIDVNGCTSLRAVNISILMANSIELEFDDLPALDSISLGVDLIDQLRISNLPVLTYLDFQVIDFSGSPSFELASVPNLTELHIDAPQMENFVLANQLELQQVFLYVEIQNKISLTGCSKLEGLRTSSSTHRFLDLSGAIVFNDHIPIVTATETANLTDCRAINSITIEEPLDTLICNGMTGLNILSQVPGTGLRSLELQRCHNLELVDLSGAETRFLDLSDCSALMEVNLTNALELESIILKNGTSESISFPNANGSLKQICADDDEIEGYLEQLIVDFPDILVSNSCPFADSNRPFLISGASYLDINNDSCSTSTQKIPYSKYRIVESQGLSTDIFAGSGGDYEYALPAGTYTVMPEVPYGDDLFTLYPEQKSVTLNDSLPSVVQDFCFISSQDLDIVDVTLIPLDVARPGFDAEYRITFTNTGSIIKDGDIVLEFPDDVLDLVSASPLTTTEEEGLLSWSFEGLIPYETRTIDFTMNLNSPMETPALVGGSILNYTARVSPIGNVTITSYWSYLNQEVVNSFDPNDKTCLDGDILLEEQVGQALKYMIRFENTGTAEAVNVVVIDTIDATSFDIRSLEVLNASHDVRTEIEGDVVKFIFDDIYLPFEDATNDGYVTFRINTLADLELGHDITNRAGIYFDFNFPIITNTTSTVVSEVTSVLELGSVDFDISYYPNPATRQMVVESAETIDEVELLTMEGKSYSRHQIPRGDTSYVLPLDDVPAGVYLIKVYSGSRKAAGRVVVK